jgi:hypothetical protein
MTCGARFLVFDFASAGVRRWLQSCRPFRADSTNRRRLLQNALGLSAGLIGLRYATPAKAAEACTLAPLRDAGLDPFEFYVKMFASTSQGAESCWWFMGALSRDVE